MAGSNYTFMIVKNPTNETISVVISGKEYTVEANSELRGVSDAHASTWKNSIHNFIQLAEEARDLPKVEKVTVSTPEAEVVIDVPEESTEEVVEEPKKEVKAKKTK